MAKGSQGSKVLNVAGTRNPSVSRKITQQQSELGLKCNMAVIRVGQDVQHCSNPSWAGSATQQQSELDLDEQEK